MTSPKCCIQNETDNINSFFNIEELQQLQDLFSDVHQVASIILHPDGSPITKPTSFCGLCNDIIRKTERGVQNCYRSDSMIGDFNLLGVSIQKCSAGLWDAVVPIKTGDKHLGSWFIGQVRDAEINEENVAEYASEIGVDEQMFIESYNRVPIMPEYKLRKIAEFLHVYVNQLFRNVYHKHLLNQANFELKQISQNISNIRWKAELDSESGKFINTFISDVVDNLLLLPAGTINNSFEKYFTYIHLRYVDNLQKAINKSLNNPEKTFTEIYEINRGDDSIAWFESTVRGYQHGDKLEIFGLTKDVTEKRQTEIKHLHFFEQVINLGLITNFDGIILDVNKVWETMLGYSVKELVGTSFIDIVHPEDIQMILDEMKRLEIGETIFYFENRYRHKNCEYITLAWSASASLDDGVIYVKAKDISNQKDAEVKLIAAKEIAEQNEQRFKIPYNDSFGGIGIHNNGRILDCNFGLSKLTGYSHDELVGMDGLLLIDKESRDLVFQNIKNEYEKPYEVIGVKKNREKFPVRLQVLMIPNEDEIVRVVEFRDISEQKRLELEQIRRERLLNETGRIAKIGGWELEIPAMNGYFSQETKRIYGMLPEGVKAPGIEGIKNYPEEVRPLLQEKVNEAIENGTPYDLKLPFITEQGKRIWVRTIGMAEKKNGKVVRLYGTIQDITERKTEEKNNIRLSEAIEQSPNCVVITNLNGTIEYVNPAFQEITGYSKKEAVGKNASILSSGYHKIDFHKDIWDTLLAGKNWQGELCNKKKNGELYWENASISPVIDKNGEVINYLAIKEDITEQKKMVNDLQVAKEKAEESDRLKSAFLANMNHEIRTPMNGILGFIKLLESPDLTELEKKDYSDIINKSGERLVETIEAIIDYSKIEAGDIVIQNEEIDITDVFEFHLAFFESDAKGKDIKLDLKISEADRHRIVKLDKNKLDSILSNLLKNALKFTNKGEITFGYHIEENMLSSYVCDTGIGISKEKINSLFQSFMQADVSSTRVYEGCGLGLAICKAYVENMGGRIWNESEIGKGSKFNFTVKI